MTRETQILEIVSRRFPQNYEGIVVGIGDDAAITRIEGSAVVSASDLAVEGVHFSRQWSTPWEIGARVCAANCADIFSMGAQPRYLLVSMVIPDSISLSEIDEIALGIADEARAADAHVVGGDISAGSILMISIAAFGYPVNEKIEDGRFLRSSAKPGESIVLSHLTGLSRMGYEILKSGREDLIHNFSAFVTQFKKPTVDYTFVRKIMMGPVGACIDVSDGLLSELGRIASASGVDIEITPEFWKELPEWDEVERLSSELKLSPEEMVLTGGEDHAFIVTTSFPSMMGGITIGKVISRGSDQSNEDFIIHMGHKRFTKDSLLGYRH